MSGRDREGFSEDKHIKNRRIIGMKKDLRTSLKQKLDHLKIMKHPRRDGQHPRILKDKTDSIKITYRRIFLTLYGHQEKNLRKIRKKEMLGES